MADPSARGMRTSTQNQTGLGDPMRSRGPILTLLVGLALAGVLGVLSVNATRTNTQLTAGPANAPAGQAAGAAGAKANGQGDAAAEKPAEKPAEQGNGAGNNGENAAPAVPAKKVTWAGRTKGGKATIAITAKGDNAIAYLCDGDRIEAWLSGTAADGRLTLAAPDQAKVDAELTGTFGGGRAKGTVSIEGEEFTFNVGLVKKPSGLYRATADVRGARLDGAWIVLADGTQVGLATYAGSTVPVEPLDTATRTTEIYGERITAVDVEPRSGS
jgi:serine/threonine-protein kinase